jgi:hypothetical protein
MFKDEGIYVSLSARGERELVVCSHRKKIVAMVKRVFASASAS